MSEDKKKKVAKKTFYFLRGSNPSFVFDPKKNRVVIKCDSSGLFATKSKKIVHMLESRGYENIEEKKLKKSSTRG